MEAGTSQELIAYRLAKIEETLDAIQRSVALAIEESATDRRQLNERITRLEERQEFMLKLGTAVGSLATAAGAAGIGGHLWP